MKDMRKPKRTEEPELEEIGRAIAAMSQKKRDEILNRIVTPRRERRTA